MHPNLVALVATGILFSSCHSLPRPEAATEPQIVPIDNGIEGLGSPTTTTTWGDKKRGAEAEAQGSGTNINPFGVTLSTPGTTIIWGPKDKREADLPDDIITFDVKGSTTTWSDKNKRVAEPQISLGSFTETVSWDTGPTQTASSCSCINAPVGDYCGFCRQIQGSWVSWNAYHCGFGGSCKSLGFSKTCVVGDSSECPI
ncbi:hypothetical protein AOQ84DRAFT_361004 [Glonium stellatum]|uniref:Uncharacterized protein n=1 Tax=Glonium stellatum TaxID=574774 RepID=A0A8E2F7L3_9PEZI|nr:hypothetical protein AOQ84DRAFT_361004 [Glonium stellatum]